MRKVAFAILYIIVAIIIVFSLISATHLSLFGCRVFRVGSGSMEPCLKTNDLVIIKKFDDYNIGDIVTYTDKGIYVTHRIISKKNNTFVTKGDANSAEDEPIYKNSIVGKVIYQFKVFSFFSSILISPISWIFLFIGGFLITLLLPDKK